MSQHPKPSRERGVSFKFDDASRRRRRLETNARERRERANERDARKECLGASPASRGWVLGESGEEREEDSKNSPKRRRRKIRFGKPKTMKKRTQQLERMSSQAERGTMKKILFYCPDMEKMAREVQANDPGALELFRALFVRERFGFSLPRSVVPFCVTNQRSLLFELFSFARALAVVYSCVQMRSNWARSNGVDFQTGTRTYSSRTRTIFEGDTWLS